MTLASLIGRVRERLAPTPARPASIARTHIGRVRTVNEDRTLLREDRGLWAVADGMGGHSAGDVAAQAAVAALAALADDPAPIGLSRLRDALDAANAAIHGQSRRDARTQGSTIAALHVSGALATFVWAGDSRGYLFRCGALVQQTRDHSVVQEMVEAGTLTRAAARTHPHASVITRAIGVAPALVLDTATVDLLPGDRLLLCTDGLSGLVEDAAIAAHLALPLAEAADALIGAALRAGGTDNVSLVLIDHRLRA